MKMIAYFNQLLSASREYFSLKPISSTGLPFGSEESLPEIGRKIAMKVLHDIPNLLPCLSRKRLAENNKLIIDSYHAFNITACNHDDFTPAIQCLVDNYYIFDKSIQQVQRAFNGNFLHHLPLYHSLKNIPRVFVLSWFYMTWTGSNFSISNLDEILKGYQSVTALRVAELWAIPELLRFVLIENVCRTIVRIEHSRCMHRNADKFADKIKHVTDLKKLSKLFIPYESLICDTAFSSHLLYRLRNGSSIGSSTLGWIENRITQQVNNLEEITIQENARQTKEVITIRNSVDSLKNLDNTNWTAWFENISSIDILLKEKSDFSEIDFHSRNTYRTAIEQIARRSSLGELDIARKALNLISHEKQSSTIAWYLVGDGRPILEKACAYRPKLMEKVMLWYQRLKIWGIIIPVSSLVIFLLPTIFFLFFKSGISPELSVIFMFLALFPTMEIAFSIFQAFVSMFIVPKSLIGFEYQDGVPEVARTLVVIPTILLSSHSINKDLRRLEIHYLSNASGAVNFALASDWQDADEIENSDDLQLLNITKKGIADLNKRYGEKGKPIFFLFHRHRQFNEKEGVWMGWERKRGKLYELNLLLRGKKTSFLPHDSHPTNIRFVLTVDSDTRLFPGTVVKMVGKLSHPLNQPIHDPKTGRVIEGYGILQPRVTSLLSSKAQTSLFQKIFSSSCGIDPYIFTTFDIYHDLVKEGTFVGKGLYNIDTFMTSLQGRIKENSILSHDLLEGGYARTAFAGDIEVMEEHPIAYGMDVARHHRWVRGDWQLLPYLWKGQIGLTMAWKILDNLRRSLTPLALITACVGGWYFLTLPSAVIWQVFLLLSLSIASILDCIRTFFRFNRYSMKRGYLYSIWKSILTTVLTILFKTSFLAHTAYYMSDAVLKSLYRMIISRKYLLEWRASATLIPYFNISAYFALMWPILPISFFSFLVPFGAQSNSTLLLAIPFCCLWGLSPIFAWFSSLPKKNNKQLSLQEHMQYRQIARKTWCFYETFVSEKTNHLPPDNFQEQPQSLLAYRTSPTNIGVYLLSIIAARDFGWISFSDTIKRIENTLITLEKLEKYQGHFFNWYAIDTLIPLSPFYVSTVDSGNLAGHLVTLSSTLKEWSASLDILQSNKNGILDVSSILLEKITIVTNMISNLKIKDSNDALLLSEKLKNTLIDFQQNKIFCLFLSPEQIIDLAIHIRDMTIEFEQKYSTPQKMLCVVWANSLVATCMAHRDDLQKRNDLDHEQKLSCLAKQVRRFAFAMNFSFLEQKERRLLSIGYRVLDDKLDSSCYDLLASEARLASFFAIAKGDIKIDHWFHLGRPLVPVGLKGALLSWSGSMFEYLMPALVMRENDGSLLAQSNNLIIRRQIGYARAHKLPWGISEAAFNARDTSANYQYSSFGIPSLGLQQGLSENTVVAPYASILAAPYYPKAAIKNLYRLHSLGVLGPYGYYDAVDFTPSRLSNSQSYAVVYNYYAHHHGMSIIAISNTVLDKKMHDRFHQDPIVEAAELLLQEKAPLEIPIILDKRINQIRHHGLEKEVPFKLSLLYSKKLMQPLS